MRNIIGQHDTTIRHSEDPRYAGSAVSLTKPVSPVDDALNRLEASINATASDFGSLAGNLSSALRAEMPPETSNPTPVTGIDLVDRIQSLSLKVESLQWHVLNVNSRLAL